MSEQESNLRLQMWVDLLAEGGPYGVSSQLLRDLGMYGGAQGIWRDKERTASITPDGTGVTVSLLHTGSSYPDDLAEDGVLYHYPRTNRPEARDLGEIEATKAAGRLRVPVFVITYPTPNSSVRDVHLGWIEGWDDESRLFLVSFQEEAPVDLLVEPDDSIPFSLVSEAEPSQALAPTRPGQQHFRFLVFQRYGPKCAVCDLAIPEVLDAVHLMPKAAGGSDDPRNGLVLCAVHHRALDARLFGIEPESLRLCFRAEGPSRQDLRITRDSISHLRWLPHAEALTWLWGE